MSFKQASKICQWLFRIMNISSEPALSIPALVCGVRVPILIKEAPVTRARSSISSAAVAMMGLAPSARVTFADCVATTLFVILGNDV
jgi:hypothetical protein